jgi:class 3 adenylate cyclase
MALEDDLKAKVKEIFRDPWTDRDGTVVPEDQDVGLGNDAVKLDAVVLYADLVESTSLIDRWSRGFAAEIYKAYLYCAARVLRGEGGAITAYDGDRIMAVFLGGTKNTSAARAALKIEYSVTYIINPALVERYGQAQYSVRQVVGIDSSDLYVARTGVRGANDLVWVGPAANYAAKLCSIREDGFNSYITERVYNSLMEEIKVYNGQQIWERRTWTAMNDAPIYRSSWWWRL